MKINNTTIGPHRILAGVPQGSVLSPHLYSIMTEYFPQANNITTALYADDIAIYNHADKADIASRVLDMHINNNILPYLLDNKIKLNPSKCECILLTKKNSDKINLPITVHNTQITVKKELTYLGYTFNRGLTHRSHIVERVKKMFTARRLLYPLIKFNSGLSLTNRILLYKQILRPTLIYGSMAESHFKQLQIAQNKTLRIITGMYRTPHDQYPSTVDIHYATQLPFLKNYIIEFSDKYYRNKLPRHILQTIEENSNRNNPLRRHVIIHEKLPLFYER